MFDRAETHTSGHEHAGSTDARVDRAEALAASTRDAIVVADAVGRIIYWNAAAADLFGHAADVAIGQSLDIIIPPAMSGEHAAGMRRLTGGGAPRLIGKTVEVPARRADGQTISIEMRLSTWRNGPDVEFGAIIRDVSERRVASDRLHSLAHFDQLTQLPNRTLFMDRLHEALSRDDAGSPFALMIVDIDRFAEINDSRGHAKADDILSSVALALKQFAQRLDGDAATAARIGPNQFGVLLPKSCDVFAATAAADGLHNEIKSLGIDEDWAVTASIGLALAPLHGLTPGQLMANADFALRSAKRDGGDGRQLFQPGQREVARIRRDLETELKRAWAQGEFEVFYQPQIALEDNAIVGAEALLRWRHPQHGLLLPGAFLPALEGSRLAEHVGDFVVAEACRHAAKWRDANGRDFRVGVNLFERQFVRADQPRRIERALRDANLAPEALELEILETAMTGTDDTSIRRVRRLRDLGVGIAFDDYGTGYASLGLLKRYPITRLKIDRSFVRDLTTDHADEAIVELVLTLGRRFGLGVIAEGVETPAQRARLVELGCVEAQGYLFGRPMSGGDFAELLRPDFSSGAGLAKAAG